MSRTRGTTTRRDTHGVLVVDPRKMTHAADGGFCRV
jgi:hypothetical protein